MKNTVIILLACVFLLISCDRKEETAILLSNKPIDPSSLEFVSEKPVFTQREKIYYILLSKDPIEDKKLRLQILKLDMKYPYHKIEPAYGIDINRGQGKHYVTDYFTLHTTGKHVIRFFGHSDLEKPIAETEFWIEPL